MSNQKPTESKLRHAKSVRENALLKSVINVCEDTIANATHPAGGDFQLMLDRALSQLTQIEESFYYSCGYPEARMFADVVDQTVEHISRHFNDGMPTEVTGITTGFERLDRITSGLQRGGVTIIAGRPSMGQTIMALNIVAHVGSDLGLPVLIISTDLPAEQIASLLLSAGTGIPFYELRKGAFSEENFKRLTSEADRLRQANIHIDDNGMIRSISELRARLRRAHSKCNRLGLIVIDSLQSLADTLGAGKSVSKLEKITKTIKELAEEMGAPIILLSELPKKVEKRKNKRPMLSDLRNIGVNDQVADAVLMLYRDEHYYLDSKDCGAAELSITKNRGGPLGTVCLTYQQECGKFE